MRYVILLFAVLITIMVASAQNIGCCCDPVLFNGSLDSSVDCINKGFIFLAVPSSASPGFTCDSFCNATLAPVQGFCGDGICQLSESSTSCPLDCAVSMSLCDDPTYRAPPSVSITPVKGKNAFNISVSAVCPASHVLIERCEGQCSDYQQVATIPLGSSFIDSGSSINPVKWNTDYSYRISVNYDFQGLSDPQIVQVSCGDIECNDVGSEIFCVDESYYDQFENYLKSFGYGGYSSSHFTSGTFSSRIAYAFGSRFNSAYSCDENNILSSEGVSCSSNEVCVAQQNTAYCMVVEDCGGFYPFGLFGSINACEGDTTPRYCFYDKSSSIVDYCFSCNPAMDCYDYKSEGACDRDNCGVGDCEWHSYGDLNQGVCVDLEKNNCIFCSESRIANSCSDDKALALSTNKYPCFYDRIHNKGSSCDDAYCGIYTGAQCSAPSNGIALNYNNELIRESSDPCNIRVCDMKSITTSTGVLDICYKNADGNSGLGSEDCQVGDFNCEKDYFPPETSIIPSGVSNRVDKLEIRVFDKTSKTGLISDYSGNPGYITNACVVTNYNDCADPSLFPIHVSEDILVKDLMLKTSSENLSRLAMGNNTLRFYSRDPNNNVEVVKEITFYACDNCQGPVLMNLSVVDGRIHEGVIYSSSSRPSFILNFDEPSVLALAQIKKGNSVIELDRGSDSASVHSLDSPKNLDGTYSFIVNSYNSNSIYMDPPGVEYPLIVDPSAAVVSFSPSNNSVVQGKSAKIQINFSTPVTLDNVTLLHDTFIDPYAPTYITTDMTYDLSTSDNLRFYDTVSGLSGGVYHIIVEATGFNSIPVKSRSIFFSYDDPNFRLLSPSFGVSSDLEFSAEVLTSMPADCTYLFDTPHPPSETQFQFLNPLSKSSPVIHKTDVLEISENRSFNLHVLCDFDSFGILTRSFNLSFDDDSPEIVSAFAQPSIIAQRYYPNRSVYVTSLNVQMDKDGFCRYSDITSTFSKMKNEFPGFDIAPKKSHSTNISVFTENNFKYYVACRSLNELKTVPESISFKVDPSLDLNISSATPVGFGGTNITLSVVSNKRVFCYYGSSEDSIDESMGDEASFTHRASLSVPGSGAYTYYVRCVSGTNERSMIPITFYVDTTPPVMDYVDDNTTHPENNDLSWFKDRIRVSFKGSDDEVNISHYLVSLRERDNPVFLFRDAAFNTTDGLPFFISSNPEGGSLSFQNDTVYFFRVQAVNKVGLKSDVMSSDGVRTDFSRVPPACENLLRDNDETDIDCGGSCEGCGVGDRCRINSDCFTNFCNSSVCAQTSCEDDIRNGWESDIDCGGRFCEACSIGEKCVSDDDCASFYCDLINNVCADAPACADRVLSPGETDIDCGGACEPCSKGKNCESSADCKANLSCSSNRVCVSSDVDSDFDGVPNNLDSCPSTPPGEGVDNNGCSKSQLFSLGDSIDDAFRLKYFNCVECPEAAGDFDFDNDKLTNLEEYNIGTDPTLKDTDNDGFSDYTEFVKGTNPLDPDDKPDSVVRTIFLYLLIILLISALSFGGWYVYTHYLQKTVFPEEKITEVKKKKEVKKVNLSKLSEFAGPKKDFVWLPVKKPAHKENLSKLYDISKKEGEPLEVLRNNLKHLPEEAKIELSNRFKLLKAGVLSVAEKKELLKKLNITSKYYDKHKSVLEKELIK